MRKLALLLLSMSFAPSIAEAAPPDLAGKWKLVLLAFGDDEFLIVDLKPAGGKLEGAVVNAQAMLGKRRTEGTVEGDLVKLNFPTDQGASLTFEGTVGEGNRALGTVKYNGTTYPARLEKSDANTVAAMGNSPSRAKLAAIARETDAKAKVAKLSEFLHEAAGRPSNATAHAALLAAADKAGLTAEDVKARVEAWAAEAKPYGTAWAAEVQTRALKALNGKKEYAGVALELARSAEAALPADASLDARGALLGMLASAAKLAGNDELARPAEAKLKEIDAKLDEEYHEKVPPFKPETFAGRKDDKGDRTVVMEIFTGAECPPCVGADVGFDALLKTYKPTEFIGLQYHLHIPGPDPLTNEDAVARQKYYGTEVRGTPTTFFDGKRDGGSGGFMQHAEAKYTEYRGVIDPALATEKKATVSVEAARTGDSIKITAKAKADGPAGAKPVLRIVLVEPSVRYPGGNKLRFHHNVVRAFPGGVEGTPLEEGKGSVEVTVNLEDVRKAQAAYIEAFPEKSGRPFGHPIPPMELADLAVVAFVQDDADKSILQGVQVPVRVVNP